MKAPDMQTAHYGMTLTAPQPDGTEEALQYHITIRALNSDMSVDDSKRVIIELADAFKNVHESECPCEYCRADKAADQ